jgi:hypothetical protein
MTIATAMKSEKGAGDEWLTPLDLWAEIKPKYLGRGVIYDPCPSKFRKLPGVSRLKQRDGLNADWSGKTLFVNPPFSDIEPWVRMANDRTQKQATILMLLPVRADQPWWHRWVLSGRLIFLRGRVNYESPKPKRKNTGASFASCLVMFDGSRGVESWWPLCHQDRKSRR